MRTGQIPATVLTTPFRGMVQATMEARPGPRMVIKFLTGGIAPLVKCWTHKPLGAPGFDPHLDHTHKALNMSDYEFLHVRLILKNLFIVFYH
jgi:hypothetical protein